MGQAAVTVLVWIATGMAVLTVIGLLVAKNVFARLHYLGLIASVGTVCACAAIVVQEGWSQAGIKAILTGIVIFFMNPVLTHATARAARVRRYGNLTPDDWKRVRFLDEPRNTPKGGSK